MKLEPVNTNHHFGLYSYQITCDTDTTSAIDKLDGIQWHKKPNIKVDGLTIDVQCFNRYDKVKIEKEFESV